MRSLSSLSKVICCSFFTFLPLSGCSRSLAQFLSDVREDVFVAQYCSRQEDSTYPPPIVQVNNVQIKLTTAQDINGDIVLPVGGLFGVIFRTFTLKNTQEVTLDISPSPLVWPLHKKITIVKKPPAIQDTDKKDESKKDPPDHPKQEKNIEFEGIVYGLIFKSPDNTNSYLYVDSTSTAAMATGSKAARKVVLIPLKDIDRIEGEPIDYPAFQKYQKRLAVLCGNLNSGRKLGD